MWHIDEAAVTGHVSMNSTSIESLQVVGSLHAESSGGNLYGTWFMDEAMPVTSDKRMKRAIQPLGTYLMNQSNKNLLADLMGESWPRGQRAKEGGSLSDLVQKYSVVRGYRSKSPSVTSTSSERELMMRLNPVS